MKTEPCASGSRPRRRARCTSGRPARRSSTSCYARHHGGVFVLRIEDTDRARSRDEWVVRDPGLAAVARSRLGRGPGPAERAVRGVPGRGRPAARDRPGVRVLLHARGARGPERRGAEGGPPARVRRALPRPEPPSNGPRSPAEGRPRTLRFRTPDEGASSFVDEIRGEVRVEWSAITDFVVVRYDGSPIFFLANAVDDLEMGITHVIRGEDLIDSTHRVLALREALGGGPAAGVRPPAAHPRHRPGASSRSATARSRVEEFRDRAISRRRVVQLPRPARLVARRRARGAWTRDEVDRRVRASSGVTHAAAAFDHQEARLDERRADPPAHAPASSRPGRSRSPRRGSAKRLDRALLRAGARASAQERAVDARANLLEQVDVPVRRRRRVRDRRRVMGTADGRRATRHGCSTLVDRAPRRRASGRSRASTSPSCRSRAGLKLRKAMPAVYIAIEGRATGLPLFDSIVLLGRERALAAASAAARARLDEQPTWRRR